MSRILIAEDEPNIIAALDFLLRRNGYDVEIARNGQQTLASIESSPPDLVLLDVMMPLRSGYDVCARIRERDEWKKIKVIMLTAKGRDADVEKGLSVGADLYVTKPFSTKDLLQKIRELLDTQR